MKVSLIRTEQTERTNNKTRTRRLRVYAPWFARCVSLIDWFQEVTKHSAIKKKKVRQTNKDRTNQQKNKNREMKRNEETKKHLEDHRTKKRTPKSTTNRTITRANDKLTHRETDEPTARPTNKTTDRISDRPPDRPTEQPTYRPTDRLNKRTTEGIVYWRNKQTKFPQTEPRSKIKNELQIQCTDKRTQRKTNKWTKASKISKKKKQTNKHINVLELCIVDTKNTKQQTKQQNLKAYSRHLPQYCHYNPLRTGCGKFFSLSFVQTFSTLRPKAFS